MYQNRSALKDKVFETVEKGKEKVDELVKEGKDKFDEGNKKLDSVRSDIMHRKDNLLDTEETIKEDFEGR